MPIAEFMGADAGRARVNAKAAGAGESAMADARCHNRGTAMLDLQRGH